MKFSTYDEIWLNRSIGFIFFLFSFRIYLYLLTHYTVHSDRIELHEDVLWKNTNRISRLTYLYGNLDLVRNVK